MQPSHAHRSRQDVYSRRCEGRIIEAKLSGLQSVLNDLARTRALLSEHGAGSQKTQNNAESQVASEDLPVLG